MVIILIAIVTVLEVFICHFNLWWIIVLIDRILFSLRMIGVTISIKTLGIVEGIAFAAMLLFNMIFAKGHIPWLRLLIFAVCGVVCWFMMFLDDVFYVYVCEDEED